MQARIRCIVVAFVVLSFTLLGGCGGGGTGPVAGQPTVLGEPVAVPAGVDPAVMQELAQALEQQLIAQGGKGISDVTGEPVYPLMRDENVLDATLAWEYNNTGDYDQNSETNIADLTPLGLHLGKTPTSSGWAAARTADGDRNDEVNISDVTPIGANFGSVVINYVVECDQHDNDTWVPVGNVAQSAGVQQGGTGVLQYSTTVTNGAPAARFRVVAGPEIAAGDLIALDGTGPGPADFTVFVAPTPDSGALPLDIMFSVTFIKAVGPIDVEIDYGDGSATDTDTSPGGSALQFNHTYTIADTFTVSVSATDNGSGETSATQVAVMPGVTPPASPIIEESNWTIYNITDDENWGKHSAVALLGDVPVIAYTRDDFNDVYFARATQSKPVDPVTQWVRMPVDSGDHRGGTVDVCECNGVPCVVYEDTLDQDIYFTHAGSAEPTAEADWSPHEVDIDGIREPQVAVVDGMPAMVYSLSSGIRYAEANVAAGTFPASADDWDTSDIDTDGYMYFPQLSVVSDAPVVAYQRAQSGQKELRYAWPDTLAVASVSDLTMTWTVVTVDNSETNSGNTVSMFVNVESPVIAYQNIDVDEYLRLASAPTATPASSASWNAHTVDKENMNDIGRNVSLIYWDGRPLMSSTYHDGSYGYVRMDYPHVDNPSGPASWGHGFIDGGEPGLLVNEETHLFLLSDGTPAVVFRTNDGLRFGFYSNP